MINSQATQQVFAKLYQEESNRHCFECGTAHPNWASLNNGIILCLKCSGTHRGFGVNVSFVRSVDMDSWSEKQLNMMLQGGNARLKDFFEKYNLLDEPQMEKKYKTKAGIYYRTMLKAIVDGETFPEAPSVEEGKEIVDFTNPAFQNATPSGITSNQPEEKKEVDTLDQVKFALLGAVTKVSAVTKQAYEKTSEVAQTTYQKVDQKVSESNIQKDMSEFGDQVSVKAKEGYDKTKDVAKKGLDTVKSGLFSAWGFIQSQTQPKKQEKQMEFQEFVDDTDQQSPPIQSDYKQIDQDLSQNNGGGSVSQDQIVSEDDAVFQQ